MVPRPIGQLLLVPERDEGHSVVAWRQLYVALAGWQLLPRWEWNWAVLRDLLQELESVDI